MNQSLKEKLSRLPKDPGAYLMKDANSRIIYVGKAKSLRHRVSSYFGATAQQNPKTRQLVTDIYDFEVIITKTEVEALLLERTLIKHHVPRYNINLRDDKEYPFLRINMQEPWPRLEKVRRRRDDSAIYLGPFGSAGQLKILIDATYRIFPLIRCSRYEFDKAKRPCNYYHMQMCLGPCTLPVDSDQYKAMMKDAINFLNGKNRELVRDLKAKMQKAAEDEQFELAALYRDQLQAFSAITEKQAVVIGDIEDADVLGFAQNEARTSVHVLLIRDGLLVNSDSFVVRSPVQTADEVMTEFLLQYYDARSLPREILIPFELEGIDDLRHALLSNHPDLNSFTLKAPSRGARLDLIDMANKNAHYRLDEDGRSGERRRVELEVLRDKLKLGRLPRRMECIDISNIQGTAIVASDVCFIDGKPAKEFYRHYIIQDVVGAPDDFASIREVIRRRLQRLLRDDDAPDLLVIDGGKGQLSAALGVLRTMQVELPVETRHRLDFDLISLAKSRVDKQARKRTFLDTRAPERSFERVFYPEQELPLALAPGTPEYRLLTQIRDEAHRFAITHHRKRRAQISQGSILEDVPGIGPALRQQLLTQFGGLNGLQHATLEQLCAVKGLRESSAVTLYGLLRRVEEEQSSDLSASGEP